MRILRAHYESTSNVSSEKKPSPPAPKISSPTIDSTTDDALTTTNPDNSKATEKSGEGQPEDTSYKSPPSVEKKLRAKCEARASSLQLLKSRGPRQTQAFTSLTNYPDSLQERSPSPILYNDPSMHSNVDIDTATIEEVVLDDRNALVVVPLDPAEEALKPENWGCHPLGDALEGSLEGKNPWS